MKMTYYISILFGIQLLLSACPPDPFEPDCPPYCPGDSTDTIGDNLPYELIWQIPLFEDTLYSLTGMNNLYNQDLFVTSKRKGPSFNEIIIALDSETGLQIWEWNNYLDDASNYFKCFTNVDNNILYESTTREVHAIDLLNGETLFQTVEYDHIPSPKISFTSGNLYHTYDYTILDNPESKLMVYNNKYNSWVIEFKIEKTDDFGVSLGIPNSSYSPAGDTILYLANRMYKSDGDNSRVDFIAYNHTADSIYWIANNANQGLKPNNLVK